MNNLYTTGLLQTDTLLPQHIRENLQKQNWYDFQRKTEKRLDMYKDNWKYLLREFIKAKNSTETNAQFFPQGGNTLWPLPIHINLFKRVVNETSIVYKAESIREMRAEITEEQSELTTSDRYSEIVDEKYNIMMMKVNQLVNVCNLVAVKVTDDENQDSGMRFDILTPDMFVPIQNPDDPSQLIGIIYTIALTDTYTNYTQTRKEILLYIGTGEEGDEPFFAEVDNTQETKIEKQTYPYIYQGEPFLPCTIFSKVENETGEFVDKTTGDDLYDANLITAELVSLWLRNYRESTGKQLVVTGSSGGKIEPKTFTRDAMAIIELAGEKGETEVTTIDYDMDLKSRWEAILQQMEPIIANHGLGLDKFKSTPQSGVSIKLQNESLRNVIELQWPQYREGEKSLAGVIRKMNNSQITGVEEIPDSYIFFMDLGRLPFEDDPQEQWEKYKEQAQIGIKSWASIYQIFNPEIGTIEDAQIAIQNNLKMNDELKRRGFLGIQPVEIEAIEPDIETEDIEISENPLITAQTEEI